MNCRKVYNNFWGMNMTTTNMCGCGRSLTGKCVGWHALTEEKYLERKASYLAKQAEKSKDNSIQSY
jgi:hypothetical protein